MQRYTARNSFSGILLNRISAVSAPGRLPIFEVFGGALIKTYENLALPFPAHALILFIIYDH